MIESQARNQRPDPKDRKGGKIMGFGTILFFTNEYPIQTSSTLPFDTRKEARQEAAELLKRVAATFNEESLEEKADELIKGELENDTVIHGMLVSAVVDYGDDPQASVTEWLRQFAADHGLTAYFTDLPES